MRTIAGVLYCNDGDWVESRLALVEELDGKLSIVLLRETAVVAEAAEPEAAGLVGSGVAA